MTIAELSLPLSRLDRLGGAFHPRKMPARARSLAPYPSTAPVLLLCLLSSPGLFAAAALADRPTLAVELTPDERAAFEERGEVFVLREAEDSKIKEGIAVAVVDLPPRRVYRVVTDNCHFADFMPYVQESCVDFDAGGAPINFQKLGFPAGLHYRVRLENTWDEGPPASGRSAWTYVEGSGNIEESRGSWTVRAHGEGATLLTYQVWTDPGGWLARMASNFATNRTLPKLISRVREQAAKPRYASDPTAGCPCPEP